MREYRVFANIIKVTKGGWATTSMYFVKATSAENASNFVRNYNKRRGYCTVITKVIEE